MEKGFTRKLAFLLAIVMTMMCDFQGAGFGILTAMADDNSETITKTAPTGTGTSDDPFKIGTTEELYWFADKVNNESETYKSANVVLTNDIVVNENVLKDDGTLNDGDFKAWTPIKSDSWYSYTGTFDGAGHTISGLYFNSENQVGGFF